MKLCRHQGHKTIDWIKAPRYHDNKILIDTKAVGDKEHLIIRFSDAGPKEKYGWFYMSGSMVRRHKKQQNGAIMCYVVPLSKREPFVPVNNCNCMNLEFQFDY